MCTSYPIVIVGGQLEHSYPLFGRRLGIGVELGIHGRIRKLHITQCTKSPIRMSVCPSLLTCRTYGLVYVHGSLGL